MRDRLFQLLAKVFNMKVSDINDSLTKEYIYAWDSLVQMELVTEIEREFNIEFSMDEIISMDSVQKIIAALAAHGVDLHATA
jgi:acyl carrier protein